MQRPATTDGWHLAPVPLVVGRRVRRRLVALVAAAAALATALALLDQPGRTVVRDAVLVPAALLTAGYLVHLTLRAGGRTRLALGWFTVTALGMAAGKVAWALEHLGVLSGRPGGPADVAWVLAVGSAFGGLLVLVADAPLRARRRAVADVVLLASAALLAVVAAVLPAADEAGQGVVDQLAAGALPVAYAALAAVALVLLTAPRHWQPLPLVLLAGALLCVVALGVSHAVLDPDPPATSTVGAPVDALALVTLGLLALGAATLRPTAGPARPVSRAVLLATPVLSVLLLAPSAMVWQTRPVSALEVWLALLLVAGVLLRRVWADREAAVLLAQALEQATRDPLTGLGNRAALSQALADAEPDASPGLVMLDLDGFKQINDTRGHGSGDELLTVVASRLARMAPPEVVVVRLGGDEFALIEPEGRALSALAEQAVAVVRDAVGLDGGPVLVSASAGYARSRAGEDHRVLLERADVALYASKEGGRDRATGWTPELGAEVRARDELRQDLRQEVAAGATAVAVVYQPVVDLADGRVVAVEALARWHHPRAGVVAPGVFVPLAEDEGLVRQLTDRVLDVVCADAERWRAAGRHLVVAVNVSPGGVDDDLPRRVALRLERHGLSPRDLVLEITERTLVEEGGEPSALLHRLASTGLRLAVDDFGTGFSSLSYLPHLPVSVLKLDATLVRGVDGCPQTAAVLESVVRLAARLGLDVVAEGVETPGEAQTLVELGCRRAQGFLWSEATSADLVPRVCLPRSGPRTCGLGRGRAARPAWDTR